MEYLEGGVEVPGATEPPSRALQYAPEQTTDFSGVKAIVIVNTSVSNSYWGPAPERSLQDRSCKKYVLKVQTSVSARTYVKGASKARNL